MKRYTEALIWAGVLLLVGVFLLLRNLGVFGPWGDLAWGALFLAVGLGFLVWFAFDLQRWWRVLSAFSLLGSGAWIVVQWRGIALGEWEGALVLFGMALGFWAVLLVRGEYWWAVIPAGVLTVLGILFGFWSRLTGPGRLTVLVTGIGLVFALLYVIRFGQKDTRWAAVPAGGLILLGLVTLMQSLNLPQVLAVWWPLLLSVAGLGIGAVALGLHGAARPVSPAAPGFDEPVPAPGASVVRELPEASQLPQPSVPARPVEAPGEPVKGEVDIYELIKQQPKADEPAPPADGGPPSPEGTQ
ncbi:MAG: hypothetical protein ACUVR4_04330 [Anaerolineae bacterium]